MDRNISFQLKDDVTNQVGISSILIYLSNVDDIAKMDFLRSYPYALDRKKNILIVMNQHHNLLKIQDKIKTFPSVRNIEFHPEEILEYHDLYEFCKSQIRKNLEGKDDISKYIEFANGPGMCRYYFRLRCYRNLFGIDSENFNDYLERSPR